MKLKEFKKELLKDKKIRKEFERFDLAFEISQMLIEARVLKGVTQVKLARMIETQQSSIARAESGNSLPSLRFLQKIAKAFNTYLLPPKLAFMEKNKLIVKDQATNTLNNNREVRSDDSLVYDLYSEEQNDKAFAHNFLGGDS